MNVNGRWVPMEVMNTIVLFWTIAVVSIGALLFWLARSGRSTKEQPDKSSGKGRVRKNKRRKR